MKPRWHAGDLIREKESGKAFFVIHVYRGVCTLIFDATQSCEIIQSGILLKRDYDRFARDIEMDATKRDLFGEALKWKYHPLPKIKDIKK